MTVNWGIIGTGDIANAFAADFEFVTNGQLVAVASRNKSRATEFATEYGIERAYEGYEKLVQDNEVDIVYIATPHSFHYQNSKLCLENEKSVLSEKPLTVNYEQAKELKDLADKKGLFYLEALWTYYLPAIKRVKKWIDNDRIGDVKLIEANFGFRNSRDSENRLFNPDLAGGALLDVGIYPVALTNLIVDSPVVSVLADGNIGPTAVDEDNASLLKFASGTLAQLASSIRTNLNDRAYIYGTKGRIEIPEFWQAKRAILNTEEGQEVFEDDRQSQGYNYEAEAVSQILAEANYEQAEEMLEKSLDNIKLLDQIREEINLKYPFEASE